MSNPPNILTANSTHLLAIMDIFRFCTKDMLSKGIGQWHYDYPTKGQVEMDIERQEVFIWEKNAEILGTITLNEQQSDQYRGIKWQFEEGEALVIHRLAVSPEAQGQRIAYQLCQFAEHFAQENQYSMIRLDAYQGNIASNRLYEKLDYRLAKGWCWFHDNELPFNCWEKQIAKSIF